MGHAALKFVASEYKYWVHYVARYLACALLCFAQTVSVKMSCNSVCCFVSFRKLHGGHLIDGVVLYIKVMVVRRPPRRVGREGGV